MIDYKEMYNFVLNDISKNKKCLDAITQIIVSKNNQEDKFARIYDAIIWDHCKIHSNEICYVYIPKSYASERVILNNLSKYA